MNHLNSGVNNDKIPIRNLIYNYDICILYTIHFNTYIHDFHFNFGIMIIIENH